MPALNIRVIGRVQGVFFRVETEEKAQALGLKGWVRNLSDGSVEIHAEGDRDRIDDLLEWCKRGPERANVEKVETQEVSEDGSKDFTILR